MMVVIPIMIRVVAVSMIITIVRSTVRTAMMIMFVLLLTADATHQQEKTKPDKKTN